MKTSIARLGGICSILLGLLSALAGLLYFLLPAEQRLGVPGSVILPSFAQDPTMLNMENLALGLIGLFGMAVVPAVADALGKKDSGWMRWTSNLANAGFAVSAVGSFLVIGRLPVIAAAYAKGDPSTQAALAAVWRTTLDPLGVWGYAVIGLWILVVSLSLMRAPNKKFSSTFSYLGFLAMLAYWLVPVAFLSHMPALFFVVAAGGGVVIALWFTWLGLILQRS